LYLLRPSRWRSGGCAIRADLCAAIGLEGKNQIKVFDAV
jgi:hypothetical protein